MPVIPGLPGGGGIIINTPSRNNSGIRISLNKILSMTVGWYDKASGEYREEFQNGSQVITKPMIGPWLSRYEFAEWAIGYAENVNNGSAGKIKRVIPAQHPARPWLYCVHADVEGHGAIIQDKQYVARDFNSAQVFGPNGETVYSPMPRYVDGGHKSVVAVDENGVETEDFDQDGMATAMLRFTDLPYDVIDDETMDRNGLSERCRYCERIFEYSFRALPLPANRLVFAQTAPQGVRGENVGAGVITLFSQTILYRLHLWPDFDETAADRCANKVNLNVFDPPYVVNGLTVSPSGAGFPAGTLLLTTYKKTRTPRDVTGRVSFTIEIGMLYQPQGHNSFPDKAGNYYPAVTAPDGDYPGGDPLHQSAEFSQMLIPPAPRRYAADVA